MTSTSEPAHLNNHHRDTLRQIFQLVSRDIMRRAVVSLLEAIGSVEGGRDRHGCRYGQVSDQILRRPRA